MCSRDECQARQASGEISLFERMPPRPSSLSRAVARRKSKAQKHTIDPRLAVTKYRRSAAGQSDRQPPRSLAQLATTVRYLRQLLISAPQLSSDQVTPIDSWLRVVGFVEDRFRAVQVDLVVSGRASKDLQYHMARTHMLILYLTADCKEYSRKFAQDALNTCLSQYWNDPESSELDDEVFCYILLRSWQPTDGASKTHSPSFTHIYRRHASSQREWPLLQWTLQLMVSLKLGHWQTALRQMDRGFDGAPAGFDVLVRCCLAWHLSWVRWKALQAYNYTWAKGEAVAASELARLLYMRRLASGGGDRTTWDEASQDDGIEAAEASRKDAPEPWSNPSCITATLKFGQSAGLPVAEADKLVANGKLLFKVAPLLPFPPLLVRDDDAFVFWCRESEVKKMRTDRSGMKLPSSDFLRRCLDLKHGLSQPNA